MGEPQGAQVHGEGLLLVSTSLHCYITLKHSCDFLSLAIRRSYLSKKKNRRLIVHSRVHGPSCPYATVWELGLQEADLLDIVHPFRASKVLLTRLSGLDYCQQE